MGRALHVSLSGSIEDVVLNEAGLRLYSKLTEVCSMLFFLKLAYLEAWSEWNDFVKGKLRRDTDNFVHPVSEAQITDSGSESRKYCSTLLLALHCILYHPIPCSHTDIVCLVVWLVKIPCCVFASMVILALKCYCWLDPRYLAFDLHIKFSAAFNYHDYKGGAWEPMVKLCIHNTMLDVLTRLCRGDEGCVPTSGLSLVRSWCPKVRESWSTFCAVSILAILRDLWALALMNYAWWRPGQVVLSCTGI